MKYRNLIISLVLLGCLAFVGYRIYAYYRLVGVHKGEEIEMNYPGLDGKNISLSSLKGNIVLVQFWASWCGPCRMENPELVQLYSAYHNKKFKKAKNFEIYSVSLDVNHDQWLYAIQHDRMNWPYHVSTLQGWYSDAAQRFGVRSIPANILLDEDGYVIGNNLSVSIIEKKLKCELVK